MLPLKDSRPHLAAGVAGRDRGPGNVPPAIRVSWPGEAVWLGAWSFASATRSALIAAGTAGDADVHQRRTCTPLGTVSARPQPSRIGGTIERRRRLPQELVAQLAEGCECAEPSVSSSPGGETACSSPAVSAWRLTAKAANRPCRCRAVIMDVVPGAIERAVTSAPLPEPTAQAAVVL